MSSIVISVPSQKPGLTYQNYVDDIQNFAMDSYLIDKYESDKIHSVTQFLELYKMIEDEDSKKPIFSQTAKFKKFPNHLKYYKYVKFSRENNTPKGWSIVRPESESDKIILFINTCLNKITEVNFESIIMEWIEQFSQLDNPDLFELIFNGIYEKCINDSKHLHLYIQLAHATWDNEQIHRSRYEIVQLENDYYVQFKYAEKEYGFEMMNEEKSLGPFVSEQEAHNEAYLLMNFKRYFVHQIDKKFKTKDINFANENVDDNVFFEKKRQITGLIDICLNMFKEKYIHMDILHIMILNFFHINANEFEKINEMEIECIHRIIKFLCLNNSINKTKYHIFDQYITIFNDYLKNDIDSKRIEFFVKEMINIIENPIKHLQENNMNEWSEKDCKNNVMRFVNSNNINGMRDYIELNLVLDEQKEKIYEYILTKILERKEFRREWSKMIELSSSNDKNKMIWLNSFDKIINNIKDLSMDIDELTIKLERMLKEYTTFSSSKKNNDWKNLIKKQREDEEFGFSDNSGEDSDGEDSFDFRR